MRDAEHCLSTMMNSNNARTTDVNNSNINVGNSSNIKPLPTTTLNQINHAKINQRQDSNLSSDSYSMMSSPGYSTKNMEAPLLQSASKMNKSKNHHHYHQNSTDSFIMSSMNKTFQRAGAGGNENGGNNCGKRQDIGVTCEGQKTPNSKLLDAHVAKLSACKDFFNHIS